MPTEPGPSRPHDGRDIEARSGAKLIVSVVIPTRNRPTSLERTLQALARQERLPEEVVIVDASDPPLDLNVVRVAHDVFPVTCLHVSPDLCAQRNTGIRRASGSHILLCDDDIEPPPDYLGKLIEYLRQHPSTGAVTGALRERDLSGDFLPAFPVPSFRHLLFAFAFQLTVWADVEATAENRFTAFPLRMLKRWYRYRGNSWSLAGWPLITQNHGPVIRAAIYGLGAALVRRDWLMNSPFDEQLGTHGIGDNYGVALGFPDEHGIVVRLDLPVLHHRAPANRLDPANAYFRRVIALHYFMRTNGRFSALNRLWLGWSLLGKAIVFARKYRGDLLRQTIRALGVIVTGRNPLLETGRKLPDTPAPKVHLQ